MYITNTNNCSFHSPIALAATREPASAIPTILVLVSSVTSFHIVQNIIHCGIIFEALTSSRGLNFAICEKLRSTAGHSKHSKTNRAKGNRSQI